jgi:tetratricopeptide (TPR) repeat protein
MRIRIHLVSVMALALAASCSSSPEQAPSGDVLGQALGSVAFPVECNADAAARMERGLALLHHMMYANAQKTFQEAAEADPSCAMAPWGVAMTLIHPLWSDLPSREDLTRGVELVHQARALGGTERERGYVETIGAYFDDAESTTEKERLVRFESAWKKLHDAYPEDPEAKAFYALAHTALADPDDKTYVIQREAGALVEEVLAEIPEHPGAHHYIIHAFDYPPLAERALPVARNYGKIAPDVPHALHMMSHIFTRLGLWDESIEWNTKSAAAALRVSQSLGAVSMHYQHALDYLTYAYLQKALDDEALEIVHKAAALEPPFHQVNRHAAAFAFSAIPARYAAERHDWSAAAALEPHTPATFPWEEPHEKFVAMMHFGRAMGLAHEGRVDEAKSEIDTLKRLHDSFQDSSPYWAKQIEIQRLSAEAWVRFLDDGEGGLPIMQEAAALEATTEKSPISPGEILPAAELLGDMLLEAGRLDEAVTAYDTALARSPGRFNSLYGAGLAAERKGDLELAREYYGRLVKGTEEAGDGRARLQHAREVVSP